VSEGKAYAKINLALVVGRLRADGKHEIATVLQRIGLHDDIALEPAHELTIEGFSEDTLVSEALGALARAAGVTPGWRVRIEKRIPVAAGLGGGSADAATALRLANELLESPLAAGELHRLAAGIGSDVPFFLHRGAQLATGFGADLAALDLPTEYTVVVLVPHGTTKESTAEVYRAFDARDRQDGFPERAAALERALEQVSAAADLAHLPPNDLATSPLARSLRELGAFRADVTGAGTAVYGLFESHGAATAAAEAMAHAGLAYVTAPVAGP
jgi:4-diphosphocytidyl-2-C-methyl-D-erythritol kinase